jgi:hypothetical protein
VTRMEACDRGAWRGRNPRANPIKPIQISTDKMSRPTKDDLSVLNENRPRPPFWTAPFRNSCLELSDSTTRCTSRAPALPRASGVTLVQTCKTHSSTSFLPYKWVVCSVLTNDHYTPYEYVLADHVVLSWQGNELCPPRALRHAGAANHCSWPAKEDLRVSGEGPARGSPAARHMSPGSRHPTRRGGGVVARLKNCCAF